MGPTEGSRRAPLWAECTLGALVALAAEFGTTPTCRSGSTEWLRGFPVEDSKIRLETQKG